MDILTYVCVGERSGQEHHLHEHGNLQENLPLENPSCGQRKGRYFYVLHLGCGKAGDVTEWGSEDLFNLGVEKEEKKGNSQLFDPG